jgi:hypothetical protein
MSSFSNTYIDYMLNWVCGTAPQNPNNTPVYLSVWSGDPFGAGTDVSANIGMGSRSLVTFTNATSGQIVSSNILVTFTSSATHANTIDHVGMHTNSTIANTTSLFGSAGVTTKNLGVGDSLTVPIGNCTVSMTGAFVNATCIDVLLDWLVGTANTPAIGTRYVSLWSGATEVTANLTGSATRQAITFGNVSSGQVATSNIVVNCVTSATNANTVDSIGIHTATTGTGNMLVNAAVTSKSLTVGDALSIPISNVQITLS